jgi:hypothetical protein
VLYKPDSSKKHQGALDVVKKIDKREEQRRSKKLFSESETDSSDESLIDIPTHHKTRIVAKPKRKTSKFLDLEAREDKRKGEKE